MFGLTKITPNPIDTIESPRFSGALGLVACPGVRIGYTSLRKPEKVMRADIKAIIAWGGTGVITLVEEHELALAEVTAMPQVLENAGLWWRHLPVMDMHIPEQSFEQQWIEEGARIRTLLSGGERIIIHCYAGLGRTGLLAARLLVEFGIPPEQAITQVREADPRRIQNSYQEDYVRGLRSGW